MSLRVALLVGPGPGAAGADAALREALDGLAHEGLLQWQPVAPPTEAVLRRQLGTPPLPSVLHLAVDATAVGHAYATVRLADAAGAPRGLNVQALAALLSHGAGSPRLLVLQGLTGSGVGPAHELAARVLASGGVSVVVLSDAPASGVAALYRGLARGDGAAAAADAANRAALSTVARCLGNADAHVTDGTPPRATVAETSNAPPASAARPPEAAPDPHADALRAKRAAGRFDVFLCHNSADKPAVKQLGLGLKERGILPWLDEWELPPGQAWQALLEQQIQRIASAAVCIGPAGISPWHQQEMRGFISEFVDRQVPVIPVLLPGAPAKPELPLFLKQFTWVDFRRAEPDPFRQLVWGITGRRDDEQS